MEKAHNRLERRTLESTTSLNLFLANLGWSSVRQVYRVTRTRTLRNPQTKTLKTTIEVAYSGLFTDRSMKEPRGA